MSNCKNSCCDDENESKCPEVKPCHEVVEKCQRTIVLQAISLLNQSVIAGSAVPFDTNLVTEGNGIIHNPGGIDFNLVTPGIYKVTFVGTVTPATITTAGVALALNGFIIPGTTISESVPAVGSHAALATQAIVKVSPFVSTVLTVVNPTTSTETFTNPNVIIQRID